MRICGSWETVCSVPESRRLVPVHGDVLAVGMSYKSHYQAQRQSAPPRLSHWKIFHSGTAEVGIPETFEHTE